MKKLLLLLSVIICFGACKNEKLAIAGSGWDDIAIINKKSGLIEWKHTLDPGDECNDIEVTPDGNILFAYSKGAKLINRNHETIWDYQANENEEIHTATRLKDGSYMLAICGEPARIVELDQSGQQTKEISFQTLIFDVHNQFRQVTKTDSGMYLVPLIEKRKVVYLSPEGRTKGTVFVGDDIFSVKELKNKNLLVSCGRDSRFVEIDLTKLDSISVSPPSLPHPLTNSQEVFKIITSDIQGGVLRYVAEIHLYNNGNKLIANSNMYSADKSQPLLLEIDKNDKVVWRLPYNKAIKNITAVFSFFE